MAVQKSPRLKSPTSETFNSRKGRVMAQRLVWITLVYCGMALWAKAEVAQSDDPLDIALQKVGLTREELGFKPWQAPLAGVERYRLGVFDTYMQYPLKIPYYLGHFKRNFHKYQDSLRDTLMYMSAKVDEGVRRGFYYNPMEKTDEKASQPDAFYTALEELFRTSGKRIPLFEREGLRRQIAALPKPVATEAARLVFSMASASRWHRRAFQDLPRPLYERIAPHINYLIFHREPQEEIKYDFLEAIGKVDYRFLYTGALEVADALDNTVKALKDFSPESSEFHFSYETPLGRIVIDSGGDSTYDEPENYLLILDFGGNDTYSSGGGNKDIDHPFSVLLDFKGDDKYDAGDRDIPAFGSGYFGYGFLLDFEGDDVYRCVNSTQGSGSFGVGVLIDYSGNDKYIARTTAQGFAQYGLGLLFDRGGNDIYSAFLASQAHGSTKGYALLVDLAGDDMYYSDDEHIIFPSAQTREHNRSMTQGFGGGLRGDLADGHSLPGGVGLLYDAEGNDQYSAGVYAQGCAYWSGVGILLDTKGDDRYVGAWYVQGAGVHAGVGVLEDEGGDDTYTARANASQGLGHDFSLGMLIDRAGNDTYYAPNLSLGTGNSNSIGLCFDLHGDDTYITTGTLTLGSYNNSELGTLREDFLNIGIFLDTQGNDTYSGPPAANDSVWVREREHPQYDLLSEKGVGLDGNYPKLPVRFEPYTEEKKK
jgi:hypothetical protein